MTKCCKKTGKANLARWLSLIGQSVVSISMCVDTYCEDFDTCQVNGVTSFEIQQAILNQITLGVTRIVQSTAEESIGG